MTGTPVILMGVCGSGKTTVGEGLAACLENAVFIDGDDFHPAANVEKMAAGIPLNDEDRLPWLDALGAGIREKAETGQVVIAACSALKKRYRDRLRAAAPGLRFVYLKSTPGLIEERMKARKGHFMKPGMIKSQFADLEDPEETENGMIVVDISVPPAVLIKTVKERLG